MIMKRSDETKPSFTPLVSPRPVFEPYAYLKEKLELYVALMIISDERSLLSHRSSRLALALPCFDTVYCLLYT